MCSGLRSKAFLPMARHGRRSESSLTVVPVIPGSGRPVPPRGLDQQERRIWKSIVDALPAHWIDPAGQQVLRRAVSLAANLERWEARLRELRASGAGGGEEAVKLAGAHGNAAKTVALLLGQLRATPRTRMTSREARSRIEGTPKAKPWEIRSAPA
jgi:hypothetical protein